MLHIDIYADIVCPWCAIGEARLERALAERPELEVTKRWRPFQLRPEMPEGGLPWREFAEEKFGGLRNAEAAFAQVTQLAEAEGLTFDFGRVASAPNTVNAHRLVLMASHHAKTSEAAHALFRGYFAEGRDLNRLDDLLEIAQEVGLEPEATRTYLQSDANTSGVWESQQEAQRLGISGVPFYIFNGTHGLSGAQPVETFLRVFDMLTAQYEASASA